MINLSPAEVVRDFWTQFGPTHEDAVASARRWLHEDLERAHTEAGIHGYRVELRNVAADDNHN